jgi:glycosyltransferase involved in cell wall biosynthesis
VLKFAQITCVYPPYKGGIANSALRYASLLRSAGHKVETFTISRQDFKDQQNDIVCLKALPGLGNGGFLPQLFFCLKGFDRVILHYPFFGASEIVWLLKRFFWKNKKKLFIHYHMDAELPNFFLKILSLPSVLIFNSLFKSADKIICASLDYAEGGKLKSIYKKTPDKFIEIPFGVDIDKFKPKRRDLLSDHKKNNREFTVLFVGGLDKAHYFKGVNVLLEAVAKIENCRLNVVGSGDLREEYEERSRGLGIAERVDFLGNISDEDLPKKYQEADCLVLPSLNKSEAFGIVLVEALASGLPVIASDLPGVREVFENGRQGLFSAPGDSDSLAEKIKYLSENIFIREKMMLEARKLAEEKYNQKVIERKLFGVLAER